MNNNDIVDHIRSSFWAAIGARDPIELPEWECRELLDVVYKCLTEGVLLKCKRCSVVFKPKDRRQIYCHWRCRNSYNNIMGSAKRVNRKSVRMKRKASRCR